MSGTTTEHDPSSEAGFESELSFEDPSASADDPVRPEPSRALVWLLAIGGLIGLVSSATLLIERILLAEDPTYVPSCSLNPVLSCGSVMVTDQAALFGFPNPILGVAAFPIVITTAMALFAGGRLARWYWLGLQLGVTAGMALISWLAYQSIYAIDALCPYCMVVWAVTIPIFWYVTLHNLRAGHFGAGPAHSGLTRTLRDYHLLGPLLVYLVLLGAITVRFWDYWSTLI